jgi:hypothetical protein
MLSKYVSLFLLCLILNGCFYSMYACPNQWHKVEGLCRADLDEWKTYKFENINAKCEAPADLARVGSGPGPGFNLEKYNPFAFMYLHTLYPPPMQIKDKKYLINIEIKLIPKERFESEIQWVNKYMNQASKDNALWLRSFHQQIDIKFIDPYLYYRRDIALATNEILSLTVKYINLQVEGKALFEKEDDTAIRRIMNSVESLNKQ